jgi:hypothetical protein
LSSRVQPTPSVLGVRLSTVRSLAWVTGVNSARWVCGGHPWSGFRDSESGSGWVRMTCG